MNQFFFRISPVSSAIGLVSVALFLTASLAYGASNTATGSPTAVELSAAAQSPSQHKHTLPSVFRKGNVYIKVSINSHPDAWMILDTGSSNSMIDPAYAKLIELKLTVKAETTDGFGSTKMETFDTDTVHLRVGDEEERMVPFESIALGGMMGPDGVAVAGILGYSFLEKKSIVIDYKHEEVYFDTSAKRANRLDMAMTLKNGLPIIKLKIASRSISSLIDTGGSYDVIITPAMAKELGIKNLMADAKSTGTVGHGGEQHIVVGKAPVMTIGDLVVRDMNAAYTTFGTASEEIGASVSLGIGFLKNYKVTLNYAANTVRFEP
ncbi:aspartyl protease family protein [Undibacterium sp. Di27W]|uniref:aspartyl protease family protein n=1 Tax=Undibacterium sp. Di27W TaxID=3413036 RepID=UPI003BF33EF8